MTTVKNDHSRKMEEAPAIMGSAELHQHSRE
jgi:hypothetical protein